MNHCGGTGRLDGQANTPTLLADRGGERVAGRETLGQHLEAHTALGAGEPDRALLALENAAAARVPQLIHALHDPALDELRDTPRFNALRQRLPDTR